jgi:hypothetical protein
MKLKSLNIKNKIKQFISNKDKFIVFSLCFMFFSIFLFIISSATPLDSLKTQRRYLSMICFQIGFYIIPVTDMKTKDKIMAEIGYIALNLGIGLFFFTYWIMTINNLKTHLIFDIIFIIPTVCITYYFIYRVYLIIKVFIKFINSLTLKIFPNSKSTPNGFKYIFERLTAVLISISGTLATVLTIAKATESLIEIFNK